MIAEAIDAAVTLGWALLVWVLLLAAAATAALYAVVVTAAVACMAVTRGIAAGLAAVQRHEAPASPPGPRKAADARVAHSRPTGEPEGAPAFRPGVNPASRVAGQG